MTTPPTPTPAGGAPAPARPSGAPAPSPVPAEFADVAPPSMNVRLPILAGLVVILVAFGGVGTWAALAPLASAVVAPGSLVVEDSSKTVQHLEGGIVKDLLVGEGDRVDAGDVLVRLSGIQAQANSALVGNQLAAARALEARLVAERDDADAVVFPEDLLDQAAASPDIAELLKAQRRQFEERQKSLSGQIGILQARIGQFRQEIEGLTVQKRSKERQVDIFEEELVGLRELFEKGYTPRTRILAMEREVVALAGEIGAAVSSIARAEKGIGEAQLQIAQTRQQFREEVVSQLREVQVQISDLRERSTVSQDVLTRTEIVAPITGVVQNLDIHTVGGVIRSGEPIMEIVPEDARLLIEAQVSPMDIDNVQVGQVAEVRFSAFQAHDIPTIEGAVVLVSADRLTDERSGQAYYLTRVEVSEEEIAKIGDRRLIPGMPTDVVIRTGERTALDYFLKPIEQFGMRAMNEE